MALTDKQIQEIVHPPGTDGLEWIDDGGARYGSVRPAGRPPSVLSPRAAAAALSDKLLRVWWDAMPSGAAAATAQTLRNDAAITGSGRMGQALLDLTYTGRIGASDLSLPYRHPSGPCGAAVVLASMAPWPDGEAPARHTDRVMEIMHAAAVIEHVRLKLHPMPDWLRAGPGGWDAWLRGPTGETGWSDLARGFSWACALHALPRARLERYGTKEEES